MITKHPYHYINNKLCAWQLDVFFESIFDALQNEMKRIVERYYTYESNKVARDDLFLIIERTWLGLFNNALIRSFPKIVTLQEFMVWGEDDKAKGRCDFLFNWNDYDILVEAKMYEFKNDWNKYDSKLFYEEKKMDKLRDVYFKEESRYYARKTLGMVLVFEWIRDKGKRLEEAKQLMDEWKSNKDAETDFLTLYYGSNRGVILYGRIEELEKTHFLDLSD